MRSLCPGGDTQGGAQCQLPQAVSYGGKLGHIVDAQLCVLYTLYAWTVSIEVMGTPGPGCGGDCVYRGYGHTRAGLRRGLCLS
eukprot:420643-Pyramimonas_sp.AAC.1